MTTLCKQEDCTSCMSCFNACPFNAISIVENKLSVKVPRIDSNKCRECGLCEKSCPILKPSLDYNHPIKAIALYTKNKSDRLTCSSGGAATTFARIVISRGGVVYGASARNTYPEFKRVSKNEQLELLKGSKYVYCDPHLIYRNVKEDLVNGIECLFIGLPCQVAGLKSYLRKDYENLFTIDLICHGTPPFEYLKSHIESKIGKYKSDYSVSFRGERDFCTTIYDSTGSILYTKNQYEDEYFTAFMRGWIYKPGCYICRFARPERISDITVGDFWGLGYGALGNYHGKVSVALINTSNGEKLFNVSKESFVWEMRTVNEAIKGNDQLRHPTSLSQEAILFHSTYSSKHSITDAFNECGISRIVKKNRIRRLLTAIPRMIVRLLNTNK